MADIIQLQVQIHILDFIAAWIVLLGFGIAYNAWVAGLEEKGHDRGYMGFIVSLGCLVTILAGLFWPTRNFQVAFTMFLAFVASGAPMVWGSIKRHIKDRENYNKMEAIRAKVRRIISEESPLSEAQQTMLEHIATGAVEMHKGSELVLLAVQQMYDPIYANHNGSVEEQQELVDSIMHKLVKDKEHIIAA